MYSICKLLLVYIIVHCPIFSVQGANMDNFMMKANKVLYDEKNDEITATGNIFVFIEGYSVNADRMRYNLKKDVISAEGNVSITNESGKVIHGQEAILRDKLKTGVISEFIIKFNNDSLLASRLARMLNKNRFVLEKSIFTPCKISCNKKPIWQLKSRYTDVNHKKHKVVYKHLFFEVYGIPIIYSPYFSHPMHNAPAQSGILQPRIQNDDFVIPFYFRIKPNLDFTITPRLSNDYTIFNGELRHKIHAGQYEIIGSYGNPILEKANNDSRPERYYLFTQGDFSTKNVNYGFDIKRASDKAYLTNYHEIYDSYLASKFYTNTVSRRNYFLLEGFYFQDLRLADSKHKTPLVLPSIQTQNVYNLAEDNSLLLNIRSNVTAYNELRTMQLFRTSLNFELMKNIISKKGHIFTLSASNLGNLYLVESADQQNAKIWYRNIPEITAKWFLPLVRHFNLSSYTVKLEPTIMATMGKKYEARFDKFGLIDSEKNELSENNIFSTNKFSGIDFHEYGNRMSYGISSSLMSKYFYVNGFLGQFIHKHNVIKKNNADYVGSLSLDVFGNCKFFHRFRTNRTLTPIRNETGINITTNKLTATVSRTELYNIKRYFATEDFSPFNIKSIVDILC